VDDSRAGVSLQIDSCVPIPVVADELLLVMTDYYGFWPGDAVYSQVLNGCNCPDPTRYVSLTRWLKLFIELGLTGISV
jgi:hypothetical protein